MATLTQIDLTGEDVEEIIALSERNNPYQIERNAQGDLEIISPVVMEGGRREVAVASALWIRAEQNGGIAFGSNSGFNLPDTSMRCPDAAWISEALYQTISKRDRRRFSPVPPEFLIEILSESDRRSVLEAKMEMWIANGVQLAWMIDPYRATLSIYRPNADVEVLDRPSSVEAGDPVAGFRLSTLLLWDE